MKKVSLILLAMLFQFVGSAQDLDSLWSVWKEVSNEDTARMKAIRKMAIHFKKSSDVDSAISLLDLQTHFAIKSGDQETLANTLFTKAVWSWNHDQDTALHYFNKAKSAYQDLGNSKKVSDCLLYLGAFYRSRGDYDRTVDLFTQSMVLLEELGDKNGMALTANNIGVIFLDRDMDNEAEHWFKRSLDIGKEVADSLRMASALVNLGIVVGKKGDLALEQQYLREALAIRQGLKDDRGMATSLINIGQAMQKAEQYDSALVYLQQALAFCDSANFKTGKAKTLNALGKVYLNQGDYTQSLDHTKQAMEIARTYGIVSEMKFAAYRLYLIHKVKNRDAEALEAFELYTSMKDSLDSETNKKALIRQEFEYQYEKEALADSLVFAQKEFVLTETSKRQQLGLVAAVLGLLLLVALVVAIQIGKKRSEGLLRTVSEQHEELKKEKKRGDGLLLNILPRNIANELMEKDEVQARKHRQVTVMFTDFQGFTELANSIDADQLVDELNTCFSAFDHLTDKYGVEKIKTIGDAYMVAGGLNEDAATGARQVVSFALRIQRFMKKHNEKRVKMGMTPLNMRVGINTGPIVAGIVGIKKFQYDIWGDTVNTASRMESSGEVGKVNVSQTTYELVKDQFTCQYRGEVEAKGKGKLKMYFVEQA